MVLSKKMRIKRYIFAIFIFLSISSTAGAFWIFISEENKYVGEFEIKVDSNISWYKLDYLLKNDDFSTNLNLSTISTPNCLVNITTTPYSSNTLLTYDFRDCLENGQINLSEFIQTVSEEIKPQFYFGAINYDFTNCSIDDKTSGYVVGPTISTSKKPLLILVNRKGTYFKGNILDTNLHFLPYGEKEYTLFSIDNNGELSFSLPLKIPNEQTNGGIYIFFEDIFISIETNQTIEDFEEYPTGGAWWLIDEGPSCLPFVTVSYDNVTQKTNITGLFTTKVKSPYLNLTGFKKEGKSTTPVFVVEHPKPLKNQTEFILKIGETPENLKNFSNLESPNNNLRNKIKFEIIDKYDIGSETAKLIREVNIKNDLRRSIYTSIYTLNSFENRKLLLSTHLQNNTYSENVLVPPGEFDKSLAIEESGNYKIQFSDIPFQIFPFDYEVFYYPISSQGTIFNLNNMKPWPRYFPVSMVRKHSPFCSLEFEPFYSLISLKDKTNPTAEPFYVNNSISNQNSYTPDKILLSGWSWDPRCLSTRILTYKPEKICIRTSKEWDDKPKIEILTNELKIEPNDNITNFNFYVIDYANQTIIAAEERNFTIYDNETPIKKFELKRNELKDYDIAEIKEDMKCYTYPNFLNLSQYNGAVILIQFYRPTTIIFLFLISWLFYFIGLTNLLLLGSENIEKFVSFIGSLTPFYFILSYPERLFHFLVWYSIPLVIIVALSRTSIKETIRKTMCKKCGHIWQREGVFKPKICPKCKKKL